MKTLKLFTTMLFTLLLSISFSQNIVVLTNNDTINSEVEITESSTYVYSKSYYISPSGVKSKNLISKSTQKKEVLYYVNSNDTVYVNIKVDGVIYSKEELLNKVMLESDPLIYYQNMGYRKIKSSGNKMILSTIIGIGGTIISSSLAYNGKFKESSGVLIGSAAVTLLLSVSASIDLAKAGKFLLKSNSDKKYKYKNIPLYNVN